MSALFLLVGRNWVEIVFQGINFSNLALAIGISFFSVFAVVTYQTLLRLRQNALKLVSLNVLIYLLGVMVGIVLLVQYKIGELGYC